VRQVPVSKKPRGPKPGPKKEPRTVKITTESWEYIDSLRDKTSSKQLNDTIELLVSMAKSQENEPADIAPEDLGGVPGILRAFGFFQIHNLLLDVLTAHVDISEILDIESGKIGMFFDVANEIYQHELGELRAEGADREEIKTFQEIFGGSDVLVNRARLKSVQGLISGAAATERKLNHFVLSCFQAAASGNPVDVKKLKAEGDALKMEALAARRAALRLIRG
jgi:hypothetical protein